jgi:primosomal protein N''
VHQRVQRELFRRAGEQLKTNLIAASQTMSDIATNKELDPAVRMKAAQWLIERLMGKTPEVTTQIDEKRYEKLLSDIDRGAIPVDEEGDGREA